MSVKVPRHREKSFCSRLFPENVCRNTAPGSLSPCLFSRGRLPLPRRGKKNNNPHAASTWVPAALVPSLVKRTGHFRRDVCVARCRGDALRLSPLAEAAAANLKWRLSPRRGRASCRWALPESRSSHRLPSLPLWTAAAAAVFIVLESSPWVTPPFRSRGREVGFSRLEAQERHKHAQRVFCCRFVPFFFSRELQNG